MYSYEDIISLSGLCEREGEKEKFEKKLEELLKASSILNKGKALKGKTTLRDDAVIASLANEEAIKNAEMKKDEFIVIPEDYYER